MEMRHTVDITLVSDNRSNMAMYAGVTGDPFEHPCVAGDPRGKDTVVRVFNMDPEAAFRLAGLIEEAAVRCSKVRVAYGEDEA